MLADGAGVGSREEGNNNACVNCGYWIISDIFDIKMFSANTGIFGGYPIFMFNKIDPFFLNQVSLWHKES